MAFIDSLRVVRDLGLRSFDILGLQRFGRIRGVGLRMSGDVKRRTLGFDRGTQLNFVVGERGVALPETEELAVAFRLRGGLLWLGRHVVGQSRLGDRINRGDAEWRRCLACGDDVAVCTERKRDDDEDARFYSLP